MTRLALTVIFAVVLGILLFGIVGPVLQLALARLGTGSIAPQTLAALICFALAGPLAAITIRRERRP